MSTVTTDVGLKRLRTGFTYTNLHPPNLRTRELSFRSRVCKFSLCTCTVHIHIYVCKYGVLQCVVVPCRALHVLQCVACENMGIWKYGNIGIWEYGNVYILGPPLYSHDCHICKHTHTHIHTYTYTHAHARDGLTTEETQT